MKRKARRGKVEAPGARCEVVFIGETAFLIVVAAAGVKRASLDAPALVLGPTFQPAAAETQLVSAPSQTRLPRRRPHHATASSPAQQRLICLPVTPPTMAARQPRYAHSHETYDLQLISHIASTSTSSSIRILSPTTFPRSTRLVPLLHRCSPQAISLALAANRTMTTS